MSSLTLKGNPKDLKFKFYVIVQLQFWYYVIKYQKLNPMHFSVLNDPYFICALHHFLLVYICSLHICILNTYKIKQVKKDNWKDV